MVARRKATTTATAARRVIAQVTAASGDGDVDPVARELARLRVMRADALGWVAELERRIGETERVMITSSDAVQ